MSTDVTTIDFAPFTAPVTSAEITAFKTESRQAGQSWARFTFGTAAVVMTVFIGMLALGLCLAGTILALSFLVAVDSGEAISDQLFGLAILVVCGLALGWFGRNTYRDVVPARSTWTRWLRLTSFARANGMFYSPTAPSPTYPGSVFNAGTEGEVHDHIYRNDGRFLDIGNYEYITGTGKSRSVHHWGFLALKLDRRLPNMVLDARGNNTIFGTTNLPVSFAPDQRLSLEGDFDRYFTLYCPKEYERDALYVFTPDLMALLIDQTQQFDVEIVDDWMFVYSSKKLNMTNIPTLNHLFRIVDTVGAKTITQTDRYADDRIVGPALNMVAPEGRRLKSRWSVVTTVFAFGLVAFWIYRAIMWIAGLFGH